MDNIEVKYLVALDKRIDFKDKKKDVLAAAFGMQAKTQEENKIEVSDLKNRIEKIFDENIQYNQIKEKLIGNTIYYRPPRRATFSGTRTCCAQFPAMTSTPRLLCSCRSAVLWPLAQPKAWSQWS